MSCFKTSFVNEDFALQYIDKLKKTSKRKRKPVEAYLCDKCLTWHLTSIESQEAVTGKYKDRQINNLKSKIIHLESEVKRLNLKLEKALKKI